MPRKLKNPRTEKVQIRLTREDAGALDLRCVQHRPKLTRPDAVEQAVQEWLRKPEAQYGKSISTTTNPLPDTQDRQPAYERITIQHSDGEHQVVVTPEEWVWVERVLEVHRGGVEKVKAALDRNLDAFQWATGLVHGSPGPSVSGPAIDPEKSLGALRESQGRVQSGMDRAAAAKEAATRSGDVVQPGGKPHKGSPGGRG